MGLRAWRSPSLVGRTTLGSALRRLLVLTSIAYLAGLVVVALLLDRFTDVWWPATVLAFAPRWIWGAPLLALVPAAYARERRLLVPLLAGLGVFLGPVMDLRVPARRIARRVAGGP